jgi:ribose transport system ATP-binding protein
LTPVPAFVQIRQLVKRYAAPVLQGIDMDLASGEVHALVGENGAGKSTLSRILAGLTGADAGEVQLDGQRYAPGTKRAAEQAGVHLVLQELHLISTLTVAENIFLDRLPHRGGWIRYDRLRTEAGVVLERLGLAGLDPCRPVAELGMGHRQMVEIAGALWRRCRLLILDEPTAALTETETLQLFDQIRRLRAEGVAVLYISHRLDEIRRIADRLSILRDGRLVASGNMAEFTQEAIVRGMVGRELALTNARVARTPGPVALEVRGLTRGDRVRQVSFEVHRGEIFGLAGLMGAGRTETLRAVFGADRPEGGTIHLNGDPKPARIRSPRDAVRLGMGMVPEDRQGQGLLRPRPVGENITLAILGRCAGAWGWVRKTVQRHEAIQWISRLAVRCRSPDQPVAELSGGNQQKVVVARWLARDVEILLLDEPTRGVDVGVRHEIHRWMVELAGRGKAVVVVSSELPELLAVADRIGVMSQGRLVRVFDREDATQDLLMEAALGEAENVGPGQRS